MAKAGATPPAEPGKQVVTTAGAAPSTAMALPPDMADALVAGAGTNNFTQKDLSIPWLRALQALSPQCVRGKDGFLPEARPGMIFNTVTKALYDGDEGVVLVPCAYHIAYTEWKPRLAGGGLVKDWGTDPSRLATCKKFVNDKGETTGKDITPEGNELVTSAMYYCLLVNPEDGSYQQVVLALSSTQLKKSRGWNSLMNSLMIENPKNAGSKFNPPMYYHAYGALAVPESGKGNDWFGWKIIATQPTHQYPNGVGLFFAAKDVHDQVVGGTLKAKVEDIRDAVVEEVVPGTPGERGADFNVRGDPDAIGDEPGAGDSEDDDLPF